MKVTLSDTARRFIAFFEEETEAITHDCPVLDDRVVFLAAAGDMAAAIGPGGRTIRSVEYQLGRTVELAKDASTPGAFVASVLAPAATRHVTLSRQNDTIAYVKVTEADCGVVIGANGKTIDIAREPARRHYDIDDVQLMQRGGRLDHTFLSPPNGELRMSSIRPSVGVAAG